MKRIFMAAFFILIGSAGFSHAAETVTIGLSLGITGKYAKMSAMQEKGFRLWAKDVNRRGGLLSKQVRLVIRDDTGDPDEAVKIYAELIQKEKVDLVFAPYSSKITEAVLPLTAKHGYPLLVSGASADSIWERGYRNVFGIYIPASRYTTIFLEMMLRNGFEKVAVAYADDPFSINVGKGTKLWAERLGMKMAFFGRLEKDLVSLAGDARDSGADILVVCGHFNEAVNMRRALMKAGWYPKAYFATVGPVMPAYYDELKELADHTFSSSQWESSSRQHFPGHREFSDAFLRDYGIVPSYHAATAFAAGQITEAAVKKAGLDRKRLHDVLQAMDAMCILGRYSVDRSGMQIRHFPVIMQWQNGKKAIVWPGELQTAEAVFAD